MSSEHDSVSPYARNSQRYIDQGLPVIPIAPGTKMPGEYVGGRWRGMVDWRRYSVRLPTEIELDLWQTWPHAGIGLLLGALSGVIAVDVDTEDTYLLKSIAAILPPSPVRKKGKKGYTAFYRHNGEKSLSWRVAGKPIIDLLCEGRQTLMPGTVHPDGMTYIWITDDTLDDFDLSQLPTLPENFAEQIVQMIEPMMTDEDRRHMRHHEGPKDIHGEIPASAGFAADYFREINVQALMRLDEWVPKMIPTAKVGASGYRCKAFWRNAEKHNVGISHTGIRDFGGDYGLTPIDLVMHAQGVTFREAADCLRAVLNIPLGEVPSFSLGESPAPKSEVIGAQPREDADPMLAAREAMMQAEIVRQQEEEEMARAKPDFLEQAPGMLGKMVGWMAQTAPKYQPELFLASALALGATTMGRLYKNITSTWPSLYVVMIAASGEGKEYPQQCVQNVLAAAGLDRLVAGSGYTSPGAIFSALQRAPSHIAIIDEMGKLLKASAANGATHLDQALGKLMEAYGKVNTFMKPQEYSRMKITRGDVGMQDTIIYNPAITILGATTPTNFYESLTNEMVEDGFLNRLLVVQSSQPMQGVRMVEQTPPPQDIVDWVRSVHEEGSGDLMTYMNPGIPAVGTLMPYDDDAIGLFTDLDVRLLERRKELEPMKMHGLLARTREKAMRVSMVVAKAMNNPGDNLIRGEAVDWAIKYVNHYDNQNVKAVMYERNESAMFAMIKKVVQLVSRARDYKHDPEYSAVLKLGGMPHTKLARNMKIDKGILRNVIESAIEQGYITRTDGLPEVGFAGQVYWVRRLPGDDI